VFFWSVLHHIISMFIYTFHSFLYFLKLKYPYYAILKVPNLVLKVSYNRFTYIHGQKTLSFYHNIHCSIMSFVTVSEMVQ